MTFAQRVEALADAVNVFVTPYYELVAEHMGDGVIKVVKMNEWFLPSPSIRLNPGSTLTVLAKDGSEVFATNNLDEALNALDALLMDYIE